MKLEKMSHTDYRTYLAIAIREYAQEKVKAGTWIEAEALDRAKQSFRDLLPNGVATKANVFFSLMIAEKQEPIGMIWVKVTKPKAFIYDFMIESSYRGKGYGTQALTAIDEWACQQNLQEIGLHVFAHNQVAHQLYKKMGYIETDITMVRRLTS